MRAAAIPSVRFAALVGLFSLLGALGFLLTPAPLGAQSASLTARIATWKTADGTIELCIDLRDAAVGETRQCPQHRRLTFAQTPENRWLRSGSLHIAPEVALWVRARRVGNQLDFSLGVSIEGQARGIRGRSWSADWDTIPADRWRQTSAISLQLPVAPHPELWGSAAGIAAGAWRLEVGKAAPEFRLPELGDADDALVSLSSVRSDNEGLTLIVFWASWAPFVSQTLSTLSDLAQSEADLLVIGINVYEVTEGAGEAFVQKHEAGHLHLADVEGSVARHYRVDGLPELFVLDADGVYRGVIRGAAPLTEILSAIHAVELAE